MAEADININSGDSGTPEPKKLKDLLTENPNLQNELNAMMAENKRHLTKQNTDLVTQLEQLKTNTKLTQEERDDLQTRITQLEEQYMTKEELAKREGEKKRKEYEIELEKLKTDSSTWQKRYADSTIQRAWQDAALLGEVLEPAVPQVVEMFRYRTQLIEDTESGNYLPIVKFSDLNEEGKEVTLDLSPVEAIKRMKELPEKFGFLFKGTAVSGTGESGGAGGYRQPKRSEVLGDMNRFLEWRKKNPDFDVSKLRG
jgi:hypothetical protein